MRYFVLTAAFLLLAGLLLAGCVSAPLTSERHVVVAPPEDLYNCQLVNFPDYRTLTDKQVARLITDLHRANVTCKTSLDAVKAYIEKAKRTVD
jgi:hypothetical protein